MFNNYVSVVVVIVDVDIDLGIDILKWWRLLFARSLSASQHNVPKSNHCSLHNLPQGGNQAPQAVR